jgi:hypothetical protein
MHILNRERGFGHDRLLELLPWHRSYHDAFILDVSNRYPWIWLFCPYLFARSSAGGQHLAGRRIKQRCKAKYDGTARSK